MLNLDYECMKYAQKVIKISDSNLENNLRKALGVLQEDGVYAMFLWLESKSKETSKELILLLNESQVKKYLLNDLDKFSDDDFNKFCKSLGKVAEDIDKLFFMKKILERTLTYALYHAKIKMGE